LAEEKEREAERERKRKEKEEKAKQEALQGLEWIADLFLSVSTPVQIAIPTLLQARGRFQAAVRRRLEANLARLHALGNQDGGWRLQRGEGGWSAVLLVPPLAGDLALEARDDCGPRDRAGSDDSPGPTTYSE